LIFDKLKDDEETKEVLEYSIKGEVLRFFASPDCPVYYFRIMTRAARKNDKKQISNKSQEPNWSFQA